MHVKNVYKVLDNVFYPILKASLDVLAQMIFYVETVYLLTVPIHIKMKDTNGCTFTWG